MRRFLYDLDTIYTLEDLTEFFEEDRAENEEMTFSQWLEDCLGKNGALTEIWTADTPKENRKHAVSLYRIQYSEDPEDCAEMWMTDSDFQFELWNYAHKGEDITPD